MPQVSRFPLKPWVKQEIMDGLWWVLANIREQKEIEMFLSDLLTRTEKTMLAKRLAVALLLEKGYAYSDIRDVLKVSTATILNINNWLDRGGQGYRLAIRRLLKREKINKFLEDLFKSAGRYVGRSLRFG